MRRIRLLTSMLVMLLMSLLNETSVQGSDSVRVDYGFSQPQITQSGDYYSVKMDGLDRFAKPGMPILPYKTAKVLIPFGSEVGDVEITCAEKVTLPGSYMIEPGQQPVPLSYYGPAEPTLPDNEVYQSADPFPEQPYSEWSVECKQGYRFIMLNLYPVEYIPPDGTVSYYPGITVTVHTTTTAPIDLSIDFLLPRSKPSTREIKTIERIIDNPEQLGSYPSANGGAVAPLDQGAAPLLDPGDYEYVIITNQALENATGNYTFQDLIAHKTARGTTTNIVTTEWIYANYDGTRPDGGEDDQTRIRNFIIDAYNNWGTTYVLLGGDGDGADVGGESGDNIVPARGFSANGLDGDTNIPADMYYACLDGSFDYNGDGVYGESTDGPGGGEVDLFAEVYVGRAPVDSDYEVSHFVEKTIAYETTPLQDASFEKALMLGEDLGWYVWGCDYKEEVRDGSSNHGYTTEGFPPEWDITTLCDRNDPWNENDLIPLLNSGTHLLNHLGHASVGNVMKLSISDVDGLTNDQYFVAYSQGCYCGSFDNRTTSSSSYTHYDCIAEHFVTESSGAFAVLMNSRYGWGNPYSTNGPGQHFDREFFDAYFGEEITNLGIVTQDSKEDNAGYVSSSLYGRWSCYTINLLGDPETPIGGALGPQGVILLDREAYGPNVDIHVVVMDSDLNSDPGTQEQYDDIVTLTASGGDQESSITMTETETDTGILTGSITITTDSIVQEDGILQITCPTGTMTATYFDAEDGTGNPSTPSATADTDCVPPVITNVQVGDVTYSYTTITWETDELSDSCVYYGTALPPDLTACDSSFVTNHAINLTGLSLDTTYYFAVESTDEAGNQTIDDNNEAYYQFHSFVPGTHYVPDEYSSIQSGIDAVADYDMIVVRPGTYHENINFFGKTITVIGEGGPELIIIDGGASGSVVTFNSGEDAGSVLEGLTITNGSALKGGGIYCDGTSAPTIANCIITGNTSTDGGGIYCDGSSAPSIANCTIIGNEATADGGGIYCAYSSSPAVVNTILRADTAGGSLNEIYLAGGAPVNISYCDIEGGWTGTGNIDCDPEFLGSRDYHLRPSSCCIDAGTSEGAPGKDIDGDARPQGNGFDIGADEYSDHRGHLVLDRNTYSQGLDVNILVMDNDLNNNPAVTEQYSDIVTITTTGGDEEANVIFTESGQDSAIFIGSLTTATTGIMQGDGILQMALMTETITATYDDADDGTGNPATPSDTALADCFPPLISGITSTPNAAGTEATIQWDTNEDSDSVVYFGESPDPNQVDYDSQFVTQHAIVVDPLTPGVTYYYNCESTDGFGNTTRDDNGGLHYQFTTPCPEDISMIPDSLSIPMCPGNVYEEKLYIDNDGCETLAFSIAENIPWLTVDPASGSVQGGWVKGITINIDASSLGVGTYEETLTVNSNDPDESSISFPITLKIGYAATVTSVFPTSGYNGVNTGIDIFGSCLEEGVKASLYGGGPYVKGSCSTSDSPLDVYASGDYAYVTGANPGFRVIDMADPANPSMVGSCYTSGVARSVYVTGDYAYVADDGSGLQVIDVSDPANPSVVGTSYTPMASGGGVYISGVNAYVADYYDLHVIDVSDPADPFRIGSCEIAGGQDVFVSGEYAYVAGSSLEVIHIADPANPYIIGSCNTPNAYVRGVYVSGGHAYVVDSHSGSSLPSGLHIIDITDPANPYITGSCGIPDQAYDVYLSGNFAYVADESSGIQAVDVSDPAKPYLAGSCHTGGYVRSIHGSGNHAYVGDANSRIVAIDISHPANPSIVGSSDKPAMASSVCVSGSYAYVGDTYQPWLTGGLEVIDISDPANPSAVGSCNTGTVQDVFVAGDYAYTAESDSGLQIIDVSDPTTPSIIGSCDTPDVAQGVYVSGNYAYLTDRLSGLQVMDVTVPVNPSIVGSYDTPGWAQDVYVSGNYAYVADWDSGLQVIDISDPPNPSIEGSCNTPGRAYGVCISGDYAYVADETSGIAIIDISGPATPLIVGSCDTPDIARNVYVSGNYAYVSAGTSGVQVVDITDPASPFIVGSSDTSHEARDVYVAGGYVYVADNQSGLQVIKDFVACTDVNWFSDNEMTATVPAGFLPGTYNLHVSKVNSEPGTLTNAFTVISSPASALADFMAIPTKGYSPLEVTFTDMSTGTIDTWDWDFDDNGTTDSTEQNPSFIYQSVGTYTVKLTVTGLGGSDGETKTDYVIISEPVPPAADFTAAPTSGIVPLEIAFTDRSTGDIDSWAWDFDNNGTTDTNDQDPTFTYQTAGTYTVKLTVSGLGGSDGETKTDYITISQPAPPVADFTADVTTGTAPLDVQFTDQSTGAVTGWSWDFGDGGISSQQDPSYAYSAAGDFTVFLTVTGPGGEDTETKIEYIHVAEPAPVAAFTADTTSGTAPLTVNFTDQSTGSIDTWQWDFGDGGTSTQQNPSHGYTEAGDYTVSLTVTGPGGPDTETKTDYIHIAEPAPVADFTADTTTGDAPLTVNFTDQSTGLIDIWQWDFGDGGTSTQQNPTYTYNYAGDFTVSLTVTGPGGSDTETKTDYIHVSEILPYISQISPRQQEPTVPYPYMANWLSAQLGYPVSNPRWGRVAIYGENFGVKETGDEVRIGDPLGVDILNYNADSDYYTVEDIEEGIGLKIGPWRNNMVGVYLFPAEGEIVAALYGPGNPGLGTMWLDKWLGLWVVKGNGGAPVASNVKPIRVRAPLPD